MIKASLKNEINRIKSQIEAVKNRQKVARYKNDPVGYCRDVLGQRLTPEQKTIAQLIVTPPYKVLVRAAHNVGKSYLAACLVNWWYDTRDPGVCLTTAPTDKQVKDILWKEVRRLRGKRGGFRGPKMARLESTPSHFSHGFTARDATAFQGQHENHVGIIFDEAEGIDGEFWDAAETMLGGSSYFMLAIYNPTTSTSRTVEEERSGGYHLATLSAMNHPNIALELDGKPPMVPSAIRLDRLEQQLAKWSEKIPEEEPGAVQLRGQWYRPGLIAQSRLLGVRPTTGFDSVFPEWCFDKACGEVLLPLMGRIVVGCDVARFGMDWTAIHGRRGGVSLEHRTANGWDTTRTTQECKMLATDVSKAQNLDPKQAVFVIDDQGVGGGVSDQLRQDGWIVIRHISSVAVEGREEDYPNLRSAMWFDLAEACGRGDVSFASLPEPVKAELRKQFTAVKYRLDSYGRRVVEDKDDTRKTIRRSPDDADATLLSYYSVANDL